jgi:hypothetical protein
VAVDHRFGPDLPLCPGLDREGAALPLSEHHGEITPGTRVRIAATGIRDFHEESGARADAGMRPRPPHWQEWGERDLTLIAPFGNRLTFHEEGA